MLKIHINKVDHPSWTLQKAICCYFSNPGWFIGFLTDDFDGKTYKSNSTVITISGGQETMFRCIADKARFHIRVSYAQVANCLIERYCYIIDSELKARLL